jgi:hypothetical protein
VFDVSLEAASLTATLQGLLTEIQGVYLDEARAFRDANIVDVTTYDELKVRDGLLVIHTPRAFEHTSLERPTALWLSCPRFA